MPTLVARAASALRLSKSLRSQSRVSSPHNGAFTLTSTRSTPLSITARHRSRGKVVSVLPSVRAPARPVGGRLARLQSGVQPARPPPMAAVAACHHPAPASAAAGPAAASPLAAASAPAASRVASVAATPGSPAAVQRAALGHSAIAERGMSRRWARVTIASIWRMGTKATLAVDVVIAMPDSMA